MGEIQFLGFQISQSLTQIWIWWERPGTDQKQQFLDMISVIYFQSAPLRKEGGSHQFLFCSCSAATWLY